MQELVAAGVKCLGWEVGHVEVHARGGADLHELVVIELGEEQQQSAEEHNESSRGKGSARGLVGALIPGVAQRRGCRRTLAGLGPWTDQPRQKMEQNRDLETQ